MKEEHKERIDSLKKLTSENIQKDVFFSELVKFLNVKVEQKELQEYIQKYYGEKIDQFFHHSIFEYILAILFVLLLHLKISLILKKIHLFVYSH